MVLGKILSKKNNWNREFQRPFECGFSSREEFRVPFSIHFFLVALIFVLFDVELVVLFPILVEVIFYHSILIIIFYILFLVILTLGLLNEWNQIALEWSK